MYVYVCVGVLVTLLVSGNSFTVCLVFKLMWSFDNVFTCIRPKLLMCCLAIIIVDVLSLHEIHVRVMVYL